MEREDFLLVFGPYDTDYEVEASEVFQKRLQIFNL